MLNERMVMIGVFTNIGRELLHSFHLQATGKLDERRYVRPNLVVNR
jgi:hypothetical protein